jgi:hypothetical protein
LGLRNTDCVVSTKAVLPQALFPGNAEVLSSYSRQKCMTLFARFARNGTWLCPTLHNGWRHAHNADPALINDERARFYPQVFREYWITKTSDERRRSPSLSRDGRDFMSWCVR